MSFKQSMIAAVAVFEVTILGHATFAGASGSARNSAPHQPLSTLRLVFDDGADARRVKRYCRNHPGRCDARSHGPNDNNHLVWGRCYIKCIMSGHPDDYCQGYNWHFCY